jgi:hypothetical protein
MDYKEQEEIPPVKNGGREPNLLPSACSPARCRLPQEHLFLLRPERKRCPSRRPPTECEWWAQVPLQASCSTELNSGRASVENFEKMDSVYSLSFTNPPQQGEAQGQVFKAGLVLPVSATVNLNLAPLKQRSEPSNKNQKQKCSLRIFPNAASPEALMEVLIHMHIIRGG